MASPNKTNSYIKRSPKKQTSDANNAIDAKDLIQGISEKEVEIEHLTTVIVAMDEKVKVLDSVREDLALERSKFQDSEANRLKLQQ